MKEESILQLQHIHSDQRSLLLYIDTIPETLGAAEDIMIDEPAMRMVQTLVDNAIAQIHGIQDKVQQILDQNPTY